MVGVVSCLACGRVCVGGRGNDIDHERCRLCLAHNAEKCRGNVEGYVWEAFVEKVDEGETLVM